MITCPKCGATSEPLPPDYRPGANPDWRTVEVYSAAEWTPELGWRQVNWCYKCEFGWEEKL